MLFLQLLSLIILIFIDLHGYKAHAEDQNSTDRGNISVTNETANVCTKGGYINETLLAFYDVGKTLNENASNIFDSGFTDIDNTTICQNRLTHAHPIETKSQEPTSIERPPLKQGNKFTTGEIISLLREETLTNASEKSEPKDHPYAVGLVMYKGEQKVVSCSGTLVSKNWVLTSAKCLYGCDSARVYAGLDVIKRVKLPKSAQMIQSFRLFPHPNYLPAVAPNYDVGLIELEKGFNLTQNVQSISLSTEPWKHHGYRDCEVTAYRRSHADEDEEAPKEYRKTTQQLGAKKPCSCSFSLGVISKSVDKFICTGGRRDIGVCDGDPGSGLVCDGKLKAVASFYMVLWSENLCKSNAPLAKPWGWDCGKENTLSVFHDTCPYLSWINGYAKIFSESDIARCQTSGKELRRLNLAVGAVVLLAMCVF